jgi:hypothetical protein
LIFKKHPASNIQRLSFHEQCSIDFVLKNYAQLRAPSDSSPLVYETSALTQEGYCEKRENNYKPIGKMIVGKHEMSLRFIIAHICIVNALPVHYCILHRSSVIILVQYGSQFIFNLSRAELYIDVSNKRIQIEK